MSDNIYQQRTFFIQKANIIHNDKYGYGLVEYVNANTKIKIICPHHGEFKQTPGKHIYGQGCGACVGRGKSSTKRFIDSATITHNSKYDYSLVVYNGSLNKVDIICPLHGKFDQIPKYHLRGHGCPECGGRVQLSQAKFIERSNKIHNKKYDYSLAKYTTDRDNVDIICKVHGIFSQSPNSHMRGSGCPTCHKPNFYSEGLFTNNEALKSTNGRFYVVNFQNTLTKEKFIKVGITKNTIKGRFYGYKNYSYEVILEISMVLYAAFHLEQIVLNEFIKHRYLPPMDFGGRTECISYDKIQNVVDFINSQ